MPNELLSSLRLLSDRDLVARLLTLAGRARQLTVEIVAHLAEMDVRDIHLREGHPSLFTYCRSVLRLSEHEAYNRIEAARAARRFPVVLDLLAEGAVNLTTVRLLAPHLTTENHRSVLDSARGRRKVEVEEIVARLAPRPDVAPSIRKVAAPKPASSEPSGVLDAVSVPTPPTTPPQPVIAFRPPVTPLSPDRCRIQLTIGGETLEKLRRAQDYCATPSRPGTRRSSSTGPSLRCWPASNGRSSRPPIVLARRGGPGRDRERSPRRRRVRCGAETRVAARTWDRPGGAARSGRFSSSTT